MSFWAELKRRNVVKVGTAYLIVAWLIAQFVDVINGPLNLPDWFDTTVLVLLGIGFPVAVLFAWIFELTPQGLKVTTEVPPEQSIRHLTGQKLNYIVTGLLAAAVLFLVVDRYVTGGSDPAVAAVAPAPPPPEAASASPARQKVAVLPCDNLSPNPADGYFAAGIHEEILNQLAKLSNLLVVARSSVMQYAQNRPTVPQIARELGATAVMECSVRYAGDDVLITAQLIDPATDSHLWSDSYPGNMSNLSTIFAMQADIAMNIANALAAEFSPAEQARLETAPTSSSEAYARFLASLAPELTSDQRLALLEQSVSIDPTFSAGHAAIATLLAQTTIDTVLASASRSWRDIEARAAQSAARALALDPNIGAAYGALATLDEIAWRWPDALRNYQRAVELSPNNVNVLWRSAWFLSFAGRAEEGLPLIDRAVELVPNMAALLVQRSLVLAYAGRFAEAREAYRQVIEVLPNSLICHAGIMFNSLQLGEPVQEQDVRALESRLGSNRLVALLPQLAYLYARVGAPADAERLIAEVEAIGQQRDIGVGTRIIAAIARDDRAEVRRWLETAIAKIERHEPDAGYFDVMTVRGNSLASPLLNEPEFRDLRAKLGRL